MATIDVCKGNTSSVAVISDSDGNSKHGKRINKRRIVIEIVIMM